MKNILLRTRGKESYLNIYNKKRCNFGEMSRPTRIFYMWFELKSLQGHTLIIISAYIFLMSNMRKVSCFSQILLFLFTWIQIR